MVYMYSSCSNHTTCLKRILKLSIYRLQIFPVKYKYVPSLQLCEYQSIRGKIRKRVCKHVLAILMTYMETRLKCWNIGASKCPLLHLAFSTSLDSHQTT